MKPTRLDTTELGSTDLEVPGASVLQRLKRDSITREAHASLKRAVAGLRSPEQVDPLIEAAKLGLSDDEIATLET